jgi:beta-lactam-binding protein with PASTA domain
VVALLYGGGLRLQETLELRVKDVDSEKGQIATGRVVEGKVVLEGERLDEGTVVTVLVGEDEESFDVSDEDERALLAAIAQADQGQVVSWDELRAQLRRRA